MVFLIFLFQCRIVRAAVDHLHPVARPLRLARGEEAARLVVEDAPRPARDRCRVGGELAQLETAEHAEIVVPGEADLRARRELRRASVRLRPVADEIAETPDLVRSILGVLSRRVRRLEQATNALMHRMNQG